MARKERRTQKAAPRARPFEEITVDALREISIDFPGDVYWLAVWIAMSDLALSTPTGQLGTTLRGLAGRFVSLADRPGRWLTVETVMARFRQHGLEGNPVIRLPPERAAEVAAFIADHGPRLLGGLKEASGKS